MFARRLTRIGCALALAVATTVAAAPLADAHTKGAHTPGTSSLAALLAKDGAGFDRNWNDFDIADNAVQAVLKAKPDSPVAVLADGKVALTAFLPTDQAFRRLATDLTGKKYRSESTVFSTLAGQLGVDTIEAVLLYHVVPGATVTYKQALRSDGAVLTTALSGSTIKVDVVRCVFVKLIDADKNDANPYVVKANLNKGNLQIAHGIDRVLRPVDLP
ncbi:MAG: fasciclin domain-containing protein [Propionibacteriaceae bacterium]